MKSIFLTEHSIIDRNLTSSATVAYFAVPVIYMRQGYRVVRPSMVDETRFSTCTLLLKYII